MRSNFVFTLSACCLACCLGGLGLHAQNTATDILQKASAAYAGSHGVKAQFSIRNTDAEGQELNETEGSIDLQDARFLLEVPDEMKAWFDGRDLWTYLDNLQEVNLSRPSDEELLMLNPVKVFMLYQRGWQCSLLKDKTIGKQILKGVSMRPADKEADIQEIQVYFDKSTWQTVSLRVVNSNRSTSDIRITQYQTGQNFPDSHFLFPQQNYPQVEVIDLR